MNRAEYKERLVRISNCLDEGRLDDALDLLDSINWRKIHNVNILLDGAALYERAEKLYDAKELLEIAHERSPGGRMIIYRLAAVCSFLGEIEEARGYYQRFIELAPNDNLRFIIKYYINKAQGADDRTLIPILEELKANELLEEWAFELACLYRTTGQVDKCIAILDEIILWFGEGPYVEKALEMKRMYKPLSEEQADKYNKLTVGDSIVEIRPTDKAAVNEYLGRTIRIPEIEVSTEKFNTVNLQAEIRKNIEEIMKASEMGEVSENMDAIRELVGDIPYLQMEEENQSIEDRRQDTSKLGEVLKSKFNEYLSEEFDGQISLAVPEGEVEDQIDGQMTIDEVMDRWERTKRAAQAALSDAREAELLEYKKKAIARASDVLERLRETEEPKESVEPAEEFTEGPAEEPAEASIGASIEESIEESIETLAEPKVENVSLTQEIADIGELLVEQAEELSEEIKEEQEEEQEQKKTFVIPHISSEGQANGSGFEIPVISAAEANIIGSKDEEKAEEATNPPVEDGSILQADQALKDINNMLQQEIDKLDSDAITESAIENIPVSEDMFSLSPRQKETLSYFANIPGMNKSLVSLIRVMTDIMQIPGRRDSGHMVITGLKGNGKTQLATDIIRILQEETGKPIGNIGRITGSKLNEKDIRILFEKVTGGALIIEEAGDLNRDTMVGLTIMMENDDSGVLVILEDTRPRVERVLNSDVRFGRKFTEKINIPLLTIDELVGFGKIYAAENGYFIDEMGVLAMYNSINLANSPDHPACIIDVKNIVDDAIDNHRSVKGFKSFFSRDPADDDDMIVLQEKDFREE